MVMVLEPRGANHRQEHITPHPGALRPGSAIASWTVSSRGALLAVVLIQPANQEIRSWMRKLPRSIDSPK